MCAYSYYTLCQAWITQSHTLLSLFSHSQKGLYNGPFDDFDFDNINFDDFDFDDFGFDDFDF